jgi:hypothetical protein
MRFVLSRPAAREPRSRWAITGGPPVLPRNAYDREAVELYMYGREAQGTPLLEFLAYYQAIEFYFPRYSEQALRGEIGNVLKNARFDPHSDRDLGLVVKVLREAGGRGGLGSERDQLGATLRACAVPVVLQEFLAEPGNRKHFSDGKAFGGSVRAIAKAEKDVLAAIVERVYALRCKIVHTKDGGGRGEIDLLLPNSPEARRLGPDIDLLRLLASQVITASSSTLAV